MFASLMVTAEHAPSYRRVTCIRAVFDYYITHLGNDRSFLTCTRWLDAVENKLSEFSQDPLWGTAASQSYHTLIFLPSARWQFIRLRYRGLGAYQSMVNGFPKRRLHPPKRVWWPVLRSPARAFRLIMEYIGPYRNCGHQRPGVSTQAATPQLT